MLALLQLKKEEVDTPEKRNAYAVCIVGCGQKGVFYALAFAEAGYKVTCVDANQSAVRHLSKGSIQNGDHETEIKLKRFLRAERISVTGDLKKAVVQSSIIVITVGARIDSKKAAQYTKVVSCCKQVGVALPKGSMVVYGGTAGLGVIETAVKETLENTSGYKTGEDFALAYNPVIQGAEQIGNEEIKIAASDNKSLEATALIFETLTKKGVKKISDLKTAEVAALFSVVKRDVEVAFVNELAVFCEKAGVDYGEASKLLAGKRELALPTIAEEDTREEVYLLLDSAENLGFRFHLPKVARKINEDMVRHAFNLTQQALRSCNKPVRRAKIAVIGATVTAGTAGADLVELLEAKGAKINFYDPQSADKRQEGTRAGKRTLNETVEGTDCIVILSEQDQLKRLNLKKLHVVMKHPAAIVDLTQKVDPQKADAAGFTYQGLGAGTK
ncbi:MAG: nucleotide sugar dehydrogenase [Candidatus Bathyarchaeota archaeon]|nr:nucleotide sugar dehydrogenase [Candidatus Bathyarchaeota archaeon]